MQETEIQLEKSTCDMVDYKLNRSLDRHNSSLTPSSGETDKYEFIEAVKRLINKFGLQTFFYLPDTGKNKIL